MHAEATPELLTTAGTVHSAVACWTADRASTQLLANITSSRPNLSKKPKPESSWNNLMSDSSVFERMACVSDTPACMPLSELVRQKFRRRLGCTGLVISLDIHVHQQGLRGTHLSVLSLQLQSLINGQANAPSHPTSAPCRAKSSPKHRCQHSLRRMWSRVGHQCSNTAGPMPHVSASSMRHGSIPLRGAQKQHFERKHRGRSSLGRHRACLVNDGLPGLRWRVTLQDQLSILGKSSLQKYWRQSSSPSGQHLAEHAFAWLVTSLGTDMAAASTAESPTPAASLAADQSWKNACAVVATSHATSLERMDRCLLRHLHRGPASLALAQPP